MPTTSKIKCSIETDTEIRFNEKGKIIRKKHYVDNKELEEWWVGWNITNCEFAWQELTARIAKICEGVAVMFHPRTEEEYYEHVHDALTGTLEKIKNNKLKFTHGRAPAFNLLTTTIFRILYSKCNKNKRQKEYLQKYAEEYLKQHAPEQLSELSTKATSQEESN